MGRKNGNANTARSSRGKGQGQQREGAGQRQSEVGKTINRGRSGGEGTRTRGEYE